MKSIYFFFAFALHLFFLSGCSSETTDQGGGTPPDIDPITLSTGASTKYTVDISWSKYNSPFLSYYYVILKDEDGMEIKRVKFSSDASTVNFIVGDTAFDLLTQGTNYSVEINAMDASDKILFPTEGYTGDLHIKNITTRNGDNKILPTQPSISFASLTREKVTVEWTASTTSDNAAIKYNLTVAPAITGSPFNGLTTLSKNITGLDPNTEYTFTVEVIAGSDSEARINEDDDKITTLPSLSGGTLSATTKSEFLEAGNVYLTWNPQDKQGTIKKVKVVVNGGDQEPFTFTETSTTIKLDVCVGPDSPGVFKTYTIKVLISDDMEEEGETTTITEFSMAGSGGLTCVPPPI